MSKKWSEPKGKTSNPNPKRYRIVRLKPDDYKGEKDIGNYNISEAEIMLKKFKRGNPDWKYRIEEI